MVVEDSLVMGSYRAGCNLGREARHRMVVVVMLQQWVARYWDYARLVADTVDIADRDQVVDSKSYSLTNIY
jgi:hypothetical protein